jgi:hypothetical protein
VNYLGAKTFEEEEEEEEEEQKEEEFDDESLFRFFHLTR